jgi:predicted HTH domain antitoxin
MITQSLVALLLLPAVSTSFLVMPLVVHPAAVSSCRHLLFSSATDDVEIASMKLREIQAELKDRGVSYADCFDRESLTQRLREARSGTVSSSSSASSSSAETVKTTPDAKTGSQSAERTASSSSSFDRQAVIEELRSMRVAELRTECGNRNIRWANMVEKEDLVQALLKARELAASFSPNLVPGQVGSLTEAQLEQELATKSSTPLLLDVYATW